MLLRYPPVRMLVHFTCGTDSKQNLKGLFLLDITILIFSQDTAFLQKKSAATSDLSARRHIFSD